ncbi:MAG: SRPBCC domain-containing protein [Planctomycetes bacterium]|nr:SRPBCC domain-containing protein [Planctomycetota bacterium]
MTSNIMHASRLLPNRPEAVFRAFEDPQMLARWWGPNGFTNEFETFEFENGGRWNFVMVSPEGRRHDNVSRFVRIERPSLIEIRHDCEPFFTLKIVLQPVEGGTRVDWTSTFDEASVAEKIRRVAEPANQQNLDRLTAVLASFESS